MDSGRKIVIVRHGERTDAVFPKWLTSCFTDNGLVYKNINLNMPASLPQRQGFPDSFRLDGPLTEVGLLQATLTGKGLLAEKVLRDGFEVYVSPALRCIQTAKGISEGMGQELNWKVEPGLLEWRGWFSDYIPKLMTVTELADNGFKVDKMYVPFITVQELKDDEDVEEFYKRSHRLISHLLSQTDKDLLLVAHGGSLDACSRQLVGEAVRNEAGMRAICRATPFCGIGVVEERSQSTQNDETRNNWSLISIPGLAMTHTGRWDFDAVTAYSQNLDQVDTQSQSANLL